MLARWAAAVRGSPRRSRALPPRATTTRIASAAQRGDHDRLDRVHPVLGLVEDDGTVGLEHLVGDLQRVEALGPEDAFADGGVAVVERRQAVHEAHPRVAGAAD